MVYRLGGNKVNYLTIALDDGYESWDEAGHILEKYGWRGTFYTCLRNVVHNRNNKRQRMFPPTDVITWKEVLSLHKRGHEIANHGTRHSDLPHCNNRELKLELLDSKEVFNSYGIPVTTYGCAFNSYPTDFPALALKHYNSFRLSLGVNNTSPKKTYHVLPPVDALNEVSTGSGKWIVSAWHDVKHDGFTKYLNTVKELNIEVLTVKQVYENKEKKQ